MSRHDLTPLDPNPAVTIGWDPPLRTFFVQVLDLAADENSDDRTVLWIGAAPREVRSVGTAIRAASRYARVPADAHIQLVDDQFADR